MDGKASPKCRGRSSRATTLQNVRSTSAQVILRPVVGRGLIVAFIIREGIVPECVVCESMRWSDSFWREEHANCADEDAQIEEQGPVLDVSEIQVHIELERRTISGGNLPEAGDAGFHVEAAVVVELVVINIVDGMRPRADKAHFAAEDVPELGKFIETVTAEDAAEAGDARIAMDLEGRTLALVAGA